MELLFSQIADIIFTLPDGSELLCTTTLNSDILRRYGYDDVNSFIDLSCMKLIPEDMFNYSFIIRPRGEYTLSPLDSFFQLGGKVQWQNF